MWFSCSEDDILKELEELSLETHGGKVRRSAYKRWFLAPPKSKLLVVCAQKTDATEEVEVEPPRPEKKKTRKGKKGGGSPEDEEADEANEEKNEEDKKVSASIPFVI